MAYILIGIISVVLAFIIESKISDRHIPEENKKREIVKAKLDSIEDFIQTKNVTNYVYNFIFSVDENNKKIAYVDYNTEKIIPFDKILSFELIEDNNIVMSKSIAKTIGGAILGNVVAGNAGTILGGLSGKTTKFKEVSKLQVKINFRDFKETSYCIDCFNCEKDPINHSISQKDKTGWSYYLICHKEATEICDILSIIIDSSNSKISVAENTNMSLNKDLDDLHGLVNMKDKGLLTDDEFEILKKRIINQTNK